MAGLTVNSISLSELLDNLREREWLTPKFQRDFVWSIEQIKQLVFSIISGYPIGMVTLWAQADDSALELEPISLPDSTESGLVEFCGVEQNAKKHYAILDGRQRSTAIAMAFAGFKASDGKFRYAGNFYLNVATKEETRRIEFFKDSQLEKLGLQTKAEQMSKGYFSLACEVGQDVNGKWIDAVQSIRSPDYYSDGMLPDQAELEYREKILREAFNGIIGTKLAVYIVPEKFDLGDICEIFETLNTTGTRVSTVDLIHSWLYADTARDVGGPVYLRDWIAEMGERDGSVGWAEREKRPELMAQMATACYIAQNLKPTTRHVGGRTDKTPISSVKAGDLLATPKDHWLAIISREEEIAKYFADFQELVANGRFPWTRCPYPTSANIYVALRWHKSNDNVQNWGQDELNQLYRAFFWRNALAGRYDQGFLTQMGADIKALREILEAREELRNMGEWAQYATKQLSELIGPGVPSHETLVEVLTDGRITGAIRKSVQLLLYATPKSDLLKPAKKMGFPEGASADLHHIYPKSWFTNNMTPELKALLEDREDWVNSTANLMLLTRESNNYWKGKFPAMVIDEFEIKYETSSSTLKSLFISKNGFELLQAGSNKIREFWVARATLIASELESRMSISV